MRYFLLAIVIFATQNFSAAQVKLSAKKYPSLFWEITGKGLSKPSYLFGTMHVSSKVAFNLSDSFYLNLRNADIVALETNPESWQADIDKFEIDYNSSYGTRMTPPPLEYLTIHSLKTTKYEKWLEQALYLNSSSINNLLYRSYGNSASDFEEDTYLDMYIYQCSKRWKKEFTGVEDYGGSMRIMAEAYADEAKEKNKPSRSYNDIGEEYSFNKMEEAYRKGDLDKLDSIQILNSNSAAFDEKFMYLRNEIQARSIDSILRTKKSLFVGVGAAHLPGTRGVIEILRKKGYKLRPIFMKERDNEHKELIEKIRVPVSFHPQVADDDFFTVNVPGKLYRMIDIAYNAFDSRQYADMANGSYYSVTRVNTKGLMQGHSPNMVLKKLDSLLYENVPGKILLKEKITNNGYQGFNIINKTRRGEVQRYNIFITPYEAIFFKMSGTGEYVQQGNEARNFFESIKFNSSSYQPLTKPYSPPNGGFSVALPFKPHCFNNGNQIFEAVDNSLGINYQVTHTTINNYSFVEEDTFDLKLMDESFAASPEIDKNTSRKQLQHQGYPALDCKYLGKDGSLFFTRFLIQGPNYYTITAHAKKELPQMQQFLHSFSIQPFVYGEAKLRKDTSLYYTVSTPVFPDSKREKINMRSNNNYDDDLPQDEADILEEGTFRSSVVESDSTGEKIYVIFYKVPRYSYTTDSTKFYKEMEGLFIDDDSTWTVKWRNNYTDSKGSRVLNAGLSGAGSSRALRIQSVFKQGVGFILFNLTDTLNKPSAFVKQFFETFTPTDTLSGYNPFVKKTNLFISDFYSKDTAIHKRAVRGINVVEFDSTDMPQLKKLISDINWTEKNYIDVKKSLISKLSAIKNQESAQYLKDLYYAAADTVELQYAVLDALIAHKNISALTIFKTIVIEEPPILSNIDTDDNYSYTTVEAPLLANEKYTRSFPNNNFMYRLYDSLPLTKTILPDILPLITLDDYKLTIMSLLGNMIDSNLVKVEDYETYYNKFYIEAKHEWRKQLIIEKNRAIAKAEENKKTDTETADNTNAKDGGNYYLSLYARLLLPFWDKHPQVQLLFKQMQATTDRKLKYQLFLQLVKARKPFIDTLPGFFACDPQYQYQLYTDLKHIKQFDMFPGRHNNHIALGKSRLITEETYSAADTIAYLDRLPATIKEHKGYVYFYKYKSKKDDTYWKLAMVGLVPESPALFEFEEEEKNQSGSKQQSKNHYSTYRIDLNLTALLSTRITDDIPLKKLMEKELKKAIFSKRKSAERFYANENEENNNVVESPAY